MHRRTDLVHALACLLALAGLLALAPAASAADPAPTLSLDTTFAPPTGIAKFDFTSGSSATDQPYGSAIDGTRTYTVGETRDATGDSQIGIIARRNDGTFDPGFSGDGQLDARQRRPSAGRDVGSSLVVLPDHRLRIVRRARRRPRRGHEPRRRGDRPQRRRHLRYQLRGRRRHRHVPDRIGQRQRHADHQRRAGAPRDHRLDHDDDPGTTNTTDDTFVALLDASGNLVPGFGTGGIRTFNRSGGQMDDRGVDIAPAARRRLRRAAARGDRSGDAHGLHLRAARDPRRRLRRSRVRRRRRARPRGRHAGHDPRRAGRLRRHAVGHRLDEERRRHRRLDRAHRRQRQRGPVPHLRHARQRRRRDQAVNSQGLDITVVPGVPDTLVVGGYVSTTDGIEWGISAFNDITGDLANAGYGDIVIPVSGQGQAVGVTAGPGWVGVAGSTLGLSSTGSSTLDSSYNNAKLLIDADK